jgi:hypothetical protein
MKKYFFKLLLLFVVLIILTISICLIVENKGDKDNKDKNNDTHDISNNFRDESYKYKLSLKMISDIKLEFSKKSPLIAFTSVKVNNKGMIYISDYLSSNIKVYNQEGKIINIIGRGGHGPGEFVAHAGIAFDKNDNLYVVDTGTRRISVFDSTGMFKYFFKIDDGFGIYRPDFIDIVNENIILNVVDVNTIYNDITSSFILGLFTKEGKPVRQFGKFEKIYSKYYLPSCMYAFATADEEKNIIYYTEGATYKIFAYNYMNGTQYSFGFHGNKYKEIKSGLTKELGRPMDESFKFECSISHYKDIDFINNRYLIVQYFNYNVRYGANGKIAYKHSESDINDNYIQIYDMRDNKYLGEIYLKDHRYITVDNEGYLYLMESEISVDKLYKCKLIIEKKDM